MRSLDPFAAVVAIWLVGVAALSLRLVGSLVQIERWRRLRTRPDAALAARIEALAARLGISRSVRALVAEGSLVPCAWGIVRPAIAVPANLVAGLSAVQLDAILLHELAHVRRHDYLVNLLQTFAETLLFFHPATWWISSLVRREREHCCDDLAVAALGDPLPYARALLHLEERRHALPSPALSARGGSLMNRIRRITTRDAAPSRLLPTASAVATLGLVAAFVGGALNAQAVAQASAAAKKAAPAPSPAPAKRGSPASATKAVPATRAPSRTAGLNGDRARGALAKTVPAQAAGRSVAPTRAVLAKTAPASPSGIAGGPLRAAAAKRAIAPPVIGPASAAAVAVDAAEAAPARAAISGEFVVDAALARTTEAGRSGLRSGGVGDASASPARSEGQAVRAASAPTQPDLHIVRNEAGRYNIKAKFASLVEVLTALAEESNHSVVVEVGTYTPVTAVLRDQSFASALETLCRAGKARYRIEGDVYVVTLGQP